MKIDRISQKLLYYSAMVLCILFCRCVANESTSIKKEYPDRVGDIVADSAYDHEDFQVCDEKWMQQHYSFSNLYSGGKHAIEKAFGSVNAASSSTEANGYITIRFIVNCKKQTGRFRVQEMDENYQPSDFPTELVDQILKITKNLDGWRVATHKKRVYDYYYYLTFKIISGKIAAILP